MQPINDHFYTHILKLNLGWIKEYKASRADPTTLQKQIDEFMIAYDEKKDKVRI